MMRDAKGLSAEQMNEFRASFNHFDRVSKTFYYFFHKFNHRSSWWCNVIIMLVNQNLSWLTII